MIAGMPNCGKSNIINSLRISSKAFNSNHVAKSHDKACVTTYADAFKVSEKPLCFLYDSPGILLPTIENGQMAYNLGGKSFFIGFWDFWDAFWGEEECRGENGVRIWLDL